ncbi:MAG: extracellular solute-binding protein [Bacilli bacterium]|nr:extracellular solute-binding protein [Bacilli bacterium]
MRKSLKFLLAAPFVCLAAGTLSGCDNNLDGDIVLRILNAEDYIYEYDPEYDEEMQYDESELAYHMDMLDQYETDWESRHPGQDLQIVYDTYDTNETMFNELKTGKTTYDVIIPSDYMVQKLASLDMLHELDRKEELWENISGYLEDSIKSVKIPDKDGNQVANPKSDYDYCVPYMWGTLGIMYNVDFYLELLQEINPDATEDDVHDLFKSWDCLYGQYANTSDEDLKALYDIISGTFSIKDSVRDTYTISLIHAFDDAVKASADADTLRAIINQCDADTVAKVMEDMLNLKANAFGFETDSGKTDMTTQKIGANLCWSGDATWAITEARENDLNLYYSLPIGDADPDSKSGSNIWFDCFCMPKNAKDENNRTPEEQAQYELGEDFIEFMCKPENAVQNTYCVGYTTAVAGDEVLEYMKSCYDTQTILDDMADVLAEPGDMEQADINALQEEYDELLQDFTDNQDDESCYVKYNLNYFFNYGNDESNEYVLIVDYDSSMREVRAQFPNAQDLPRLAIMNDFGPSGNQRVLDMWETVRTNPLPTWAIVLFICEGVAVLAIAGLIFYKVFRKKHFQKLRKAGEAK